MKKTKYFLFIVVLTMFTACDNDASSYEVNYQNSLTQVNESTEPETVITDEEIYLDVVVDLEVENPLVGRWFFEGFYLSWDDFTTLDPSFAGHFLEIFTDGTLRTFFITPNGHHFDEELITYEDGLMNVTLGAWYIDGDYLNASFAGVDDISVREFKLENGRLLFYNRDNPESDDITGIAAHRRVSDEEFLQMKINARDYTVTIRGLSFFTDVSNLQSDSRLYGTWYNQAWNYSWQFKENNIVERDFGKVLWEALDGVIVMFRSYESINYVRFLDAFQFEFEEEYLYLSRLTYVGNGEFELRDKERHERQ